MKKLIALLFLSTSCFAGTHVQQGDASITVGSATINGASGMSVTFGIVGGSLTLNNVSGTQCLHSISGAVSGTGSDCGAGGGNLAVATGTAAGFPSGPFTSAATAINFDSTTFKGSLQGAATAFMQVINVPLCYSTTSAGGYWPWPWSNDSGVSINPNLNGTTYVAIYHYSSRCWMTFSHISFQLTTASGSCSPVCGLVWGVYSSTGGLMGTSTSITSTTGLNSATPQVLTSTMTASVTLQPYSSTVTGSGDYFFALAIDTTSVQLHGIGSVGLFQTFENQVQNRVGTTNNGSSGSGASLTLPQTTGGISPKTNSYGNPPLIYLEP